LVGSISSSGIPPAVPDIAIKLIKAAVIRFLL